MSDQDATIFTEGSTAPTVNSDQSQTTPVQTAPDLNQVYSDQLAGIKNEAGEQKYKDVATAIAALQHSQDHVRNLEAENAKFKAEGTKAASIDEVLQQLKSTNNNQTEQTGSPELDVDQLQGITLDTIKRYEAQKQEASNQAKVVEALTGKFQSADKAKEAYAAKAAELGMPVDLFNKMAATSPKAVLNYFDVKTKAQPSSIEGTVNTDALQQIVQPVQAKKNIMYGASTSDIVNAWRAAGQSTES